MKSLTVARECQRSVLPTFIQDINDLLVILGQQKNSSKTSSPNQLYYADQSESLSAYVESGWECPAFDSNMTKHSYRDMVNQTYSNYKDCTNNYANPTDHWWHPKVNVDAQLDPVKVTCLLDAVANMTTATISVIITVRRTTACAYVVLFG